MQSLSYRLLAVALVLFDAGCATGAPPPAPSSATTTVPTRWSEGAAATPRSEGVSLAIDADRLSAGEVARSRQAYDYVRAALFKANVDPVIASQVLMVAVRPDFRARFTALDLLADDPSRYPRPSIQQLACWKREFLRIDRNLNDLFPDREPTGAVKADGKGGATSNEITMGPVQPVTARELLDFSLQDRLARSDLDSECAGSPGSPVTDLVRWQQPIRIASLGIPRVDALMKRVVDAARRLVPSAPLDDRSFPAPSEQANVIFSRAGTGTDALWCTPGDPCSKASAARALLDRAVILQRSYWTQAHLWGAGAHDNALIVTADDEIVEAFCEDSWGPAPSVEASAERQMLSCLLQAMGAYPAPAGDGANWGPNEISPTPEQNISLSVSQLGELYRKRQ